MAKRILSARICSPLALHASEEAAWERLSSTFHAMSSPFLSLHFARAVAQTGMDARVCVIYEDDQIRGFFPFQFPGRLAAWSGMAARMGGEMADYFGLIAEPGFHIKPAELLSLAKINYLNFSHLEEIQLAHGLTGEQPRTGLRIKLDGAAAGSLQGLDSAKVKYLKDTQRRERQLVREVGPVKFAFDVQDGREQALQEMITMKRAQYRRTNVQDALADPWKRSLLHRLSHFRYASCRGVLSVLSAGDQWMATHFGILGNGVLQFWLPVYNPDLAKYAPGRLLLHRVIEASSEWGFHTIDRGEGDTPSKRDLANDEHLFYRGAWHNRSASSQLVRGILSIKWRFGI